MALLHFDGFEHNADFTQFGRDYLVTVGGNGSTTGRVAGLAKTLASTQFESRSFGLRTTLVTGFGFRISTNPGSNKKMSFLKGGAEQFHWEFINGTTGFEIEFFRDSTSLGVTTEDFGFNQWHYFEIKVVVDTGVAGSIELRRNEVTVLTLNSIDTAHQGSSGADSFFFDWSSGATGNPFMDDWYILDNQGTDNTDFLGDSQVEGFTMTADGSTIQWTRNQGTTNVENIDDPTSPQDGTNTNESDTIGQIDLFDASNLQVVIGTIFGVKLDVQLAMTAAGMRSCTARYRDTNQPGEATGGMFNVDEQIFSTFSHIFERNPVTSVAWVNADIDDGQFGYEVTA